MTVVLAGCDGLNVDSAGRSGGSSQDASPSHVHLNGLQLFVSENYLVRMTPAGFAIETPRNDQRRNPIYMSVRLLPSRPEATGHRVQYLRPWRLLWYSVTEEEGGSSGSEWTVHGYEHVGDHWIEYWESKLSEDEPDELWRIAKSTRYVPPGRDENKI